MPKGIYPNGNRGLFKKGDNLGNTNGFKKGHKIKLGKPNPAAKNNPQVFKKGMTPWNKGIKTGIKPPNWKGGESSEEKKFKDSYVYREWRKSIFTRDDFTCKKCKEKVGGRLQAHHILNFMQYPELRTSEDNGITFCVNCHNHFHKKYGFRDNTREQVDEYIKS